jgi:hypothetical protein
MCSGAVDRRVRSAVVDALRWIASEHVETHSHADVRPFARVRLEPGPVSHRLAGFGIDTISLIGSTSLLEPLDHGR